MGCVNNSSNPKNNKNQKPENKMQSKPAVSQQKVQIIEPQKPQQPQQQESNKNTTSSNMNMMNSRQNSNILGRLGNSEQTFGNLVGSNNIQQQSNMYNRMLDNSKEKNRSSNLMNSIQNVQSKISAYQDAPHFGKKQDNKSEFQQNKNVIQQRKFEQTDPPAPSIIIDNIQQNMPRNILPPSQFMGDPLPQFSNSYISKYQSPNIQGSTDIAIPKAEQISRFNMFVQKPSEVVPSNFSIPKISDLPKASEIPSSNISIPKVSNIKNLSWIKNVSNQDFVGDNDNMVRIPQVQIKLS